MDTYPGTFAFVQIHHGDDYDVTWGTERWSFYNPGGTPHSYFDGVIHHVGAMPYSTYEADYLARRALPTDVTVAVGGMNVGGSDFEITAEVCLEADGTEKTVRVHMVQVLDHWPASPTYHRNGVKQGTTVADTGPPGQAEDVDLTLGNCERVVRTFTFDGDSMADVDNIKIIAWAQEPEAVWPAEVHQAAIMTWPFEPLNALIMNVPGGVPEFIEPGATTDLTVEIENAGESYVPDSGLLHYRFDGGEFQTTALASLGGNLYEATLPAPDCGTTPEYYFTAEGDGGTTVYLPEDAPTDLYTATVAHVTIDDDFETDMGWAVTNVPSGAYPVRGFWEREVPLQCVPPNGDPPGDFDGSGTCWLTENNNAPDSCNSDVDNGTTILTSPTFDLTGAVDPILRYARWYTNDDGPADSDNLVVEISDDDGASWVLVESVSDTEGWVYREFHINNFGVSLNSQFVVQFSAADLGGPGIIEAAVDMVAIYDPGCASLCGDFDGDGDVDLDDYSDFPDCMAGPDTPPSPTPPTTAQDCLNAFDCDGDDDADEEDFASFTLTFTGS